MIRKILRITLKTILIFILLIGLYAAAAFGMPYIKTNTDYKTAGEGVIIYIESNGVHTDFVLPVKHTLKDWSQCLPYKDFEAVDSNFSHIALGWGDKGFFLNTPTWADLTFSTAFRAISGLSSTAMHVTYKRYTPVAGGHCRKLVLSEAEYQTLISYIENSFKTENACFAAIKHPGYSMQDCFYEANGTYSLFNTCNAWTGKGLKATGVKIGIWTPFESGIMQHLQ